MQEPREEKALLLGSCCENTHMLEVESADGLLRPSAGRDILSNSAEKKPREPNVDAEGIAGQHRG